MKVIYEYLDYRHYLADYYKVNKELSTYFSLRSFAQRLGIDPSYLSKILSEQRHMGVSYIDSCVEALRLDTTQGKYFEALVHFNREQGHSQKQLYFERLIALRKTQTHCLLEEQLEYYRRWYYTALRHVLEFYPFFEGYSFAELGRQLSPAISANQARQGIELLERLSLIQKDEKGRYILTESSLTTGDSWRSLAVRAFQEETIQLSRESLDRHPNSQRDVSTVTMNITEKEFLEINKMIKSFRSSVITYAHGVQEPDRIYQLNIQLIPLSSF